MPKRKAKARKKYRYFTKVSAQRGSYVVKHVTKAAQRKYEKILAKQRPYFRKIGTGKL